MNPSRKGLLLLVLILILLYKSSNSIAQEGTDQGIEFGARAGFDGHYKAEYWVPVTAKITNKGPGVDGKLQVVVGNPASGEEVIYSNPISLPNGSSKQQTFFVFLPGLTGDITVRLLDDIDQPVAEATTDSLTLLGPEDLLYGVVSTEPTEFSIFEEVEGSRDDAAVAFLNLEDLPEVANAWNSLDVIIFHEVDTGQLTTKQLEAMQAWLEAGGQILVSGGPGWQKTVAGLNSLLPVKITGIEAWEDLPALKTQAGQPFRDPGPYLVTTSHLVSGEVLQAENGVPILARRHFGRGSVHFLALDPALPPLADWDGNEFVYSQIAQSAPLLPLWGMGAGKGYAASNAATSLPSLALPSGLHLLLFLLLYIVIIGPVNYFVLSRRNHRELAWLTIPVLVIIFTGIAYTVGFRLKGNNPILNQLSIAFGDIESDKLRVQSLLGLYSPTRDTYDLTLPADANVRPFSQSFGTLAGGGNIDTIERGSNLHVRGLRLDVSDVETLVADSYQSTPALSAQVNLKLANGQFIADISVQNNSDVTFENVTLLIGTKAIAIGDLEAGESIDLSQHITSFLDSSTASSTTLGYAPVGPSTSPLAINYGTILGSTEFFNDPDIYPRWQLLESIGPEYISSFPESSMLSSATLVAWTDEEQLDISIDDDPFESVATTLYFLEIPIDQNALNGEDVHIPWTFLDWRILGDSGIYNPGINDFYFPPGWVEFEFTPWVEFRDIEIDNLGLVIQTSDPKALQPVPTIKIWNWSAERWDRVDDLHWGQNPVSDHESFVGPGSVVRLRLENNSSAGIGIQEFYPDLAGDLGS